MKKIFLTFILVLGIVISNGAPASAQSCEVIEDQQDYAECCLNYSTQYSAACDAFRVSTTTKTPAQWTAYCNNLTVITQQQDFNDCCMQRGETPYAVCDAWSAQSATPAIPGTINGGTQNTNSVFTEQPRIGGNPAVSPQSSSAALASCSAIKFKSLLDILIWIKCIITSVLIPLIFTLAFLFFLWNVLTFIRSSDKTNKEEAKQRMVWGIIALFVMLGVWGIIKILSNTLGLETTVPLLQTTTLDPAKASR